MNEVNVGDEFVCIDPLGFGTLFTRGEIYKIDEVMDGGDHSWPYRITGSGGDACVFTYDEIHGIKIDDSSVLFLPMSQFSDKSQFQIKMTGKIP